ncbi:MAG: hypothetical protein WCT36_04805 [Candidatus Gracilibacteria bacterium]|jgi:uncharacterized protein (TIGR04552 family)
MKQALSQTRAKGDQFVPEQIGLTGFILEGGSPIDFDMPIDISSYATLMRQNGYDTTKDVAEIDELVQEAIDFSGHMFVTLKAHDCLRPDFNIDISDKILGYPQDNDRLRNILDIAYVKSVDPRLRNQAAVIAKIMLGIIIYKKNVHESKVQDKGERALKKLTDENFIQDSKSGEWHFRKHLNGKERSTIGIHFVRTGRKGQIELIRKFLAKKEANADTVHDWVRERVVTKGPADLIRLCVQLIGTGRIPWNLSREKTPKHTLFAWGRIYEVMRDHKPEKDYKLMRRVIEEGDDEAAVEFFSIRDAGDENPHSVSIFNRNFFSFVFDVPMGEGDEMETYPIEIQFSYGDRARQLWSPRSDAYHEADHDQYVLRQYIQIGRRFGICPKEVAENEAEAARLERQMREIGELAAELRLKKSTLDLTEARQVIAERIKALLPKSK